MSKIIHIEDAKSVCELIKAALEDRFGLTEDSVKSLDFEKAAINFIDSDESAGVLLIIVDLMITYHSDVNVEIPDEVLLAGSFDAGFRLIERLRNSEAWRNIPIVIYSSVEKAKVEERLAELKIAGIPVCQKSDSLEPLLSMIQEMAGLERVRR